MERFYQKSPVLFGLLFGCSISVGFVLFEFMLVATKISECGVIVDSCLRVAAGILTLILLKFIYKDKFIDLFKKKISLQTWIYCIPFFLYLLVQFLYFPIAKQYTVMYTGSFLLVCLQQVATGFWEEAASKGVLMSGMLRKWKGSIRGRIGMVFLSGLLFGAVHILNFVFGNDIVACLWNSLYAGAFGVFVAAIYLYSESLLFCMILHTVWDIVIRIPNYFCDGLNEGVLLSSIYVMQDVLELAIFPIVAIVICIVYKPRVDYNNYVETKL